MLSEHTSTLRKGLVQPFQCVSVAIIMTTKDPTVTTFPIKISLVRGQVRGRSRRGRSPAHTQCHKPEL